MIDLWSWEAPEEAEEDLAFYASSSLTPWLPGLLVRAVVVRGHSGETLSDRSTERRKLSGTKHKELGS